MQRAFQAGGRHGRGMDGVLLDRPLDAQPAGVDRSDVLGVGVAQNDVVAVAHQAGGDGAADRPSPDHGIAHRSILSWCDASMDAVRRT